MKKLPEALLVSLEGVEGFDRSSFEEVHRSGEQVTSIRINPFKEPVELSFPLADQVPWTSHGYYLDRRPSFTFDPLFHAGTYYVQEASSMFLEQAFRQLIDLSKPVRALDLCAAPGGKSTHIQSLISEESLLVSNEVIRNRCLTLIDNTVKWAAGNVLVTNNDPAAFKKLEGYFDVIVVDAPCSGSGLFRRDEEAIDEWSLNDVHLCWQRQQRILADVLPSLKEGGILIYSTCSYSKEEDENIADWLVSEFDMENVELEIKKEWQIVSSHSHTNAVGYRFYPDKIKGEGFFMSCFRKRSSTKNTRLKAAKPELATSRERSLILPWLNRSDITLVKERDRIFAINEGMINYYHELRSLLNIQYAGIAIGQIMKEKLVPDHALAMSRLLHQDIPANHLEYEDAVIYLQKQELNISTNGKGWQLAKYKGQNLGWLNVLSNRINNYYPKEMRILKRTNDAFEK